MSSDNVRNVIHQFEECHIRIQTLGELLLISCKPRPVYTKPQDLQLSTDNFVCYRDSVIRHLNKMCIISKDISSQIHAERLQVDKHLYQPLLSLSSTMVSLSQLCGHIAYLMAVNTEGSTLATAGVVTSHFDLVQSHLELKFVCDTLKRSHTPQDLNPHLLVELCSTITKSLARITDICKEAADKVTDSHEQDQFKMCVKAITSTTGCLVSSIKNLKSRRQHHHHHHASRQTTTNTSNQGTDYLQRVANFCLPVTTTSTALTAFATEEKFLGAAASLSPLGENIFKSVLGLCMSMVSASVQMFKASRDLLHDPSRRKHKDRISLCVESITRYAFRLRDFLLSYQFTSNPTLLPVVTCAESQADVDDKHLAVIKEGEISTSFQTDISSLTKSDDDDDDEGVEAGTGRGIKTSMDEKEVVVGDEDGSINGSSGGGGGGINCGHRVDGNGSGCSSSGGVGASGGGGDGKTVITRLSTKTSSSSLKRGQHSGKSGIGENDGSCWDGGSSSGGDVGSSRGGDSGCVGDGDSSRVSSDCGSKKVGNEYRVDGLKTLHNTSSSSFLPCDVLSEKRATDVFPKTTISAPSSTSSSPKLSDKSSSGSLKKKKRQHNHHRKSSAPSSFKQTPNMKSSQSVDEQSSAPSSFKPTPNMKSCQRIDNQSVFPHVSTSSLSTLSLDQNSKPPSQPPLPSSSQQLLPSSSSQPSPLPSSQPPLPSPSQPPLPSPSQPPLPSPSQPPLPSPSQPPLPSPSQPPLPSPSQPPLPSPSQPPLPSPSQPPLLPSSNQPQDQTRETMKEETIISLDVSAGVRKDTM